MPAGVKVATRAELDALICQYLTGETPQTYWEEQHASLRFDSIEEALEALHDPYFLGFIPEKERPFTALVEVQEYRRYSSDLALAWELVERFSGSVHALRVRRGEGRWIAQFGESPMADAPSAPMAICLAALRARGIDVELAEELAGAVHAEAA